MNTKPILLRNMCFSFNITPLEKMLHIMEIVVKKITFIKSNII